MYLENTEPFMVTAKYGGKEARAIFVLQSGTWDQYPEQLKQDTAKRAVEKTALAELGDVPYVITVEKGDSAILLDGVNWDGLPDRPS